MRRKTFNLAKQKKNKYRKLEVLTIYAKKARRVNHHFKIQYMSSLNMFILQLIEFFIDT